MSDLCIFRVEFENNIVIFEISVLEFVLSQSLVQKKKKNREKNFVNKTKIPKFCSKTALFAYFWLEFGNNILIFAKFCEKTKIPKFGSENA